MSYIHKLVTSGNVFVGKTQFTNRLVHQSFDDKVQTTLGFEMSLLNLSYRGIPVSFQIWDTAGQERFISLTNHYYNECYGVFLLFDCTAKDSFTSLSHWVDIIRTSSVNGVLIILLANKIDLNKWGVEKSEIDNFVKRKNLLYYEISAKTGENISEMIQYFIEELFKSFPHLLPDDNTNIISNNIIDPNKNNINNINANINSNKYNQHYIPTINYSNNNNSLPDPILGITSHQLDQKLINDQPRRRFNCFC